MESGIALSLPVDMSRENTCFFTGHRSVSQTRERCVHPHLVRSVLRCAEEGYRYFISGGALGFDLLAARTVVLLRQEFGCDVNLILALPCRDQTARWLREDGRGMRELQQYHLMKSKAQTVLYLSPFYYDGCMKERNRFMADHAGRCIAYWNGSRRGGTAQTVRMAKEAGLPVWNLYPASSEGGEPEMILPPETEA